MGHQLHAIAGRNNDAFFNPGMRGEITASVRQARFRDCEALAHLDRSAVVIHANKLKSHETANLCMALK
jgi:hypothetical protein